MKEITKMQKAFYNIEQLFQACSSFALDLPYTKDIKPKNVIFIEEIKDPHGRLLNRHTIAAIAFDERLKNLIEKYISKCLSYYLPQYSRAYNGKLQDVLYSVQENAAIHGAGSKTGLNCGISGGG